MPVDPNDVRLHRPGTIAEGHSGGLTEVLRPDRQPVHRIRYLRLLNDLHRRTLDTQRQWLDDVERALAEPTQQDRSGLTDL